MELFYEACTKSDGVSEKQANSNSKKKKGGKSGEVDSIVSKLLLFGLRVHVLQFPCTSIRDFIYLFLQNYLRNEWL